MAESKQKRRSGFFDVFIRIITGTKPDDLRPYQKFNVVMTLIIAVVILILFLPPALALLNSIIVTIANAFISIYSTRELLVAPAGASVSEWTYLACLLLLLVEFILCHHFCLKAQMLNSDSPPDGDH